MITHESEQHGAGYVSAKNDAQAQNDGERNRTLRIVGFLSRCSNDVESNERVKACSCSTEDLQNRIHCNFLSNDNVHLNLHRSL